MEKEKAIKALNSLITINNDRIEGYETASKETDEHDLKTLFAQFILTSYKCKQELVMEVNAIGGGVKENETTVSGKFFRFWMDVKTSLTNKDRKAILNSCEYGEDQAKETYDDVLDKDFAYLSSKQQSMVISQKSLLKVDHNHVKSLRNSIVDIQI